jgi:hypothetical protein
MPRPDPRAPHDGQIDLFENSPIKRPDKLLRGRHSEAIDRSIAAARRSDLVDELDDALLTVIRHCGWALDALESQNRPYGAAKLVGPVVEALTAARLTPDARASATSSAVDQLLMELADDSDTKVPHAADSGRA